MGALKGEGAVLLLEGQWSWQSGRQRQTKTKGSDAPTLVANEARGGVGSWRMNEGRSMQTNTDQESIGQVLNISDTTSKSSWLAVEPQSGQPFVPPTPQNRVVANPARRGKLVRRCADLLVEDQITVL